MTDIYLFPFEQYYWLYGAFLAFVLATLAVDLGVFHREAHEVGFRESLAWSVVWVTLGLAFAGLLYAYADWKFPRDPRLVGLDHDALAKQTLLEYLTGFVVEKALVMDNVFVFAVVFSYFGIPAKYQHRVLFYGILGALFFRIIFIAAGSVLMQYHWVVIAFGVLLLLTGVKILLSPNKPMDPGKNPLIRFLTKRIPVSPHLDGQKFFVRHGGKLLATPLLICLIFIEISDIIFALDSVPAIFAITKEPLIVLTSNVFAILGLRAMYFMLAGLVHRFRYLKYGLGLVLVFVGLKMVWLNQAFGGKFPISWSLLIISVVLAGSITASFLIRPHPPVERATA